MMGEYNAESKTYSACAGAVTSPWTPPTAGRLVGVRLIESGDAATTLTQHVQAKLTCASFKPINSFEVGLMGSGLQTAPAKHNQTDYTVDQPIQAGVPITIEARNLTADTPVGVLVHIYGCFEGPGV
jgi:hypothetical protein